MTPPATEGGVKAGLLVAAIIVGPGSLYVGYSFLDENTQILIGLLCLNVLLIAAICWLVWLFITAFESKDG